MTYTKEAQPKNLVKLMITVPALDLQPYLEHSAGELTKNRLIDGFRPDHTPYSVAKQHFCEMQILQSALDAIVRKTLYEVVEKEDLHLVGSPDISIEKLAPNNDLIYSAICGLMPEISQLADFNEISISAKKVLVADEKIDGALRDLQRMRTKEEKADRPATMNDKVVVDFTMKKNNVVVDGGTAKDHAIYMEEHYYVPGLREELVGLKPGDTKSFRLKFPENHYQKHIAGNDIDYDVTMKEVYALTPPALDDAFAVQLGKKSLVEIRGLIGDNIREELEITSARETEVELLEKLALKSKFSDIPELLVNDEVEKMMHELEHSVEEKGLAFTDYLQSIKKTPNELKLDLAPAAIRRLKVALVLSKSASKLEITVNDTELDQELDLIAKEYEQSEAKEKIYSPEFREYERVILRNRKTIAKLKELMVKPAE